MILSQTAAHVRVQLCPLSVSGVSAGTPQQQFCFSLLCAWLTATCRRFFSTFCSEHDHWRLETKTSAQQRMMRLSTHVDRQKPTTPALATRNRHSGRTKNQNVQNIKPHIANVFSKLASGTISCAQVSQGKPKANEHRSLPASCAQTAPGSARILSKPQRGRAPQMVAMSPVWHKKGDNGQAPKNFEFKKSKTSHSQQHKFQRLLRQFPLRTCPLQPREGASAGFDSDGMYTSLGKKSQAKHKAAVLRRTLRKARAELRPLLTQPIAALASTKMTGLLLCLLWLLLTHFKAKRTP